TVLRTCSTAIERIIHMRKSYVLAAASVLLLTLTVFFSVRSSVRAQDEPTQERAGKTMRPVIRGRYYAATSMKQEATRAAERILEAGGNAFDAIVAGQAALAVTDPSLNGLGSDTVILVYDAKAKKVFSVNGEGTAPKLATIEWYKTHADGKIPANDSLLSGTVPGVVDAWYTLLDRWGTMSFAQVLEQAIDLADNGYPLDEITATAIAKTRQIRKYPSTMKVYMPNGQAPKPGDLFRNPDLAQTMKKMVESEKENLSKGRHEALKAARDRFYKGDIAREFAKFSEENGGLFRYEDFANYKAEVEEPVHVDYRGYQIYKNPSASQGPAELITLNLLEGYDLKSMGHNSAQYIHTTAEALKLAFGDREKYLGDMDFIKIPYDGLLSKDYAGERRKLIDPDHASLELRPGNPERFMKGTAMLDRPVAVNLTGDADHMGDTSYIAVVDKDRNMVSFEP